jgi:tetratricopeptide (TPR) repeat protein
MTERRTTGRVASAVFIILAVVLAGGAGGCGGKRPPVGVAALEVQKAATANSRGVRAYNSGRYERAAGLFAESLRINRSLDNRGPEVMDLINLGRTHASMGELATASGYLEEAATLAEATADRRLLSEVHATYARVEYMAGEHARSLAHLDRSLGIDLDTGYEDIGGKLNLKGILLMASGEPDAAKEALERALTLNDEHGHRSESANSLRALATLAASAGELTDARERLDLAYAIDREEGNPGRIAVDLEQKAAVELKAERPGEAVFLLERSYQVNLSAGLTARAIKNLELIISTLDAMGSREASDRYTTRKEALIKELQER